VSLSLADRRYSHLILIPAIAAFFLFLERCRIFAEVRFSPKSGAVLALASLLVPAPLPLSLLMLATCLFWASAFALCYGVKAFKAARFPFLLLLLLVPVPSPWVDAVIAVLRRGAAETANALFSLLGTPMFRHGTTFELRGLTIDITPECSSIHSGWALFITGILAGHLFLKSLGPKLGLTALTVPIAMFTNGVRIVTLSLLSVHVDRGFLSGDLHHRGGFLFSLISLSILLAFLYALRKMERRGDAVPVARAAASGQ
jgi:exosortase